MRFKKPENDDIIASAASSSSTELTPRPPLSTLQSFLVITSSITAEVCCGAIFILNFYIPYFVSYVRLRGSKPDINIEDGKLLLLLLATSFGMSGYPLGVIVSRIPDVISLTVGVFLFILGYVMVFLGVEFEYGFVISGVILLGVSAMLISISVLLRCLKTFRDHWGIVSGSLIGVAFGSTAIFYIWEKAIVNPNNITPRMLNAVQGEQGEDAMLWYFESEAVLDRCAEFFWILAVCLVVLLSFPMIVYRVFPSPTPLERDRIPFVNACVGNGCNIMMDIRFLLAFVAFVFGGVAGLSARSSLKTRGEGFIADEHFLSSVGSSGAFAGAVGAICMGIILDLASNQSVTIKSPKLLLLNCILGFTASVMMMFAPKEGRVWFLFCYDVILFAFGGFSAVLVMVLFEIFGVTQFAVAFGISNLSTFVSAVWYTFSMFSGLPWKDFWMANAFFSFIAVISSVGLILQYQVTGRIRVDNLDHQDLSLTYDDDDSEFIIHDGKKYVLQRDNFYQDR